MNTINAGTLDHLTQSSSISHASNLVFVRMCGCHNIYVHYLLF